MKKYIIALIVLLAVGTGVYFLTKGPSTDPNVIKNPNPNPTTPITDNKKPEEKPKTTVTDKEKTVIGKSVEGKNITAYHYGTGDTELLFVGGIHGGYEWNTVLVAYQMMDYLKKNPTVVPKNIKVTVIPVLNPDGLNKVVGTATGDFTQADVSSSEATVVAGRFNANNVDLNRNFDCAWQSSSTWQNKTVSGGSKVFSEPESQAIKKYVEINKPTAVVAWFSAAGGVYSSSCNNGVSAETKIITKKYADASGYPAYDKFSFYEITGDMLNWLAKNNTPAISVLLTNHTDTEWTKNQKGIEALFKYYAK